MKAIANIRLLRWCALAFVCAAPIAFGVHKVFSENYEAHVTICTRLPGLANFKWMTSATNGSIEKLLQRDQFAYNKFTESFSNPVRVSASDNGAILYLTRVWKTKNGYLILSSGRDPRDFEMHIRCAKEMPTLNKPFEKIVRMTTVTKEFLENYEVVMIPIGSRGVAVRQTDAYYSLNGRIVEQAGTGQPATRPESKSEGGDQPQPEAEGRSR
jgi:hypothetical protein